MPAWIQRIETSVPPTSYSREVASELMQAHATERRAVRRVIRSIYRNSGIEQRHSVIDDFGAGTRDTPDGRAPLFFGEDGLLPTPGTAVRNEVYTREARHHFEALGRALLRNTPGVTADDVTHLVTISCTGFFAPGPDIHVVQALGLPASTRRCHVGFMGCYAAIQGLRMARDICTVDPDAVVLVLSVELCTLHLQFTEETDDLIAGAVFADGGAGALVRGRPGTGPALRLDRFHTALAPEGEEDMAWTIGDHGFRMKLSTYVPRIIEARLDTIVPELLASGAQDDASSGATTPEDVAWWAVHPGGRQILDRVEEALALDPHQLGASRHVLQNYGNMSSATILFVLRELLEGRSGEAAGGEPPAAGDTILALAFGPGLTIESGLLVLED